MSILSACFRKRGGSLLSSQSMRARQAQGCDAPWVGIGVLGSEALTARLAAHVVRQLTQRTLVVVSAACVGGGTPA